MKSKKINYILLLSSIFLINGCGNSSTSDNTTPTEGQEDASYFTPDTSTKTKGITSGSRNLYKVTQSTVLEDAEDGETNGWRTYDNTPSDVTISNVYDNNKGSNVIELKGAGVKNGALFSLENATDGKTLKWSMKFNEEYVIYVRLDTRYGVRYIHYTPVNSDYGQFSAPYDNYIHHGLGTDSKNGTWQTFSRDLNQDLKEFEPFNYIKSIEGLYIRGSGHIDDINIVTTETDDECIGYLALKQKIDNNEDVTQANTSCITDMSGLFSDNHTFNQDISSWDVSNVTNMAWMFSDAQAFNQQIFNWDTSKVTNMEGMFNHAYSFNQYISWWDTSKVTNMAYMFTHAKAFNQNLNDWDVSKVRDMKFMFEGASSLTNKNFNRWNITTQIDHEGFLSNTGGENIEPQWSISKTLLEIREALLSQLNYTHIVYDRDIIDLPNNAKLVRIKTGYAHINNNLDVTRFDATYGWIGYSPFTFTLSKDKTKLYIFNADEMSYYNLQTIDLIALKEIRSLDLVIPEGTFLNLHINHNNPPIHLSEDETQLIIPKEYEYTLFPNDARETIITLSDSTVVKNPIRNL